MNNRLVLIAAAAAAPFCAALPAQAAVITGWNTANVVVGPVDVAGASVIYDRLPTLPGAVTNGRVAYEPPEANSPGLKVVNGSFSTGGGPNATALQGCIMASSGATCDSPFQSGKRFKNQITGTGPIDFVFDVTQDDNSLADLPYQVYHRLVNQTGLDLAGFTISLGTGVGAGFAASTASDGLGFDPNFRLPGGGTGANSQFPFGLFGNAAENDNFTLDGFFAAERAGFNMSFSEDVLASAGLYGPYESLFGPWMSQDAVPAGAFFDFDNNDATDDLLLAWLNGDGLWELRREVEAFDPNDPASLVVETLDDPLLFGSYQDLLNALDPAVAALLGEGVIEDLANLNLNYAVLLGDAFTGSQFTLRVDANAAAVAPVPLPMAAPLLIAGLGGLALVGRRRGRAAV